jgi:NhaA family Na+:H+ antiporter
MARIVNERPPLSGETPLERLAKPFQEFAKLEASGGILLIACTVAALIWANSPWAASYFSLWHTKLTFGFAGQQLSEELHFWINDGLMAIFFLLVGLEIKREALVGELASLQKRRYQWSQRSAACSCRRSLFSFEPRGPARLMGRAMATDIASPSACSRSSAIACRLRSKSSRRVAIADDIGAVLVIAFFYSAEISWISLAVAGALFVALIVMNRIGARHPLIYAVLGLGLWLAFLQSGIHATVAGVLLALTIPARQRINADGFLARSEKILDEFRRADETGDPIQTGATRSTALSLLAEDCQDAESPMLRFEHALAPWTKHVIMPIFALANAGIIFGGGDAFAALVSPISAGVICGLALGKPIGIVGFSWLAIRLRLASLPGGVAWRQIIGVGVLAGIGFTMSLFIADLAFGSKRARNCQGGNPGGKRHSREHRNVDSRQEKAGRRSALVRHRRRSIAFFRLTNAVGCVQATRNASISCGNLSL